MKNSKSKGELTEGLIIAKLLSLGYSVSIPFGNNQRYDIIVDIDGDLKKVQCKTGKKKNGCVSFWTCSSNGFTYKKTGYKGQIDYFMVYCPDNEGYYKVSVNDAANTQCNLRIDKPNGGTTSHIKWAKDYLLT